jgi:hypothetical protein
MVALDGDTLLSHGTDAFAVRNKARANGVEHPLMVRLPKEPEGHSEGFWL